MRADLDEAEPVVHPVDLRLRRVGEEHDREASGQQPCGHRRRHGRSVSPAAQARRGVDGADARDRPRRGLDEGGMTGHGDGRAVVLPQPHRPVGHLPAHGLLDAVGRQARVVGECVVPLEEERNVLGTGDHGRARAGGRWRQLREDPEHVDHRRPRPAPGGRSEPRDDGVDNVLRPVHAGYIAVDPGDEAAEVLGGLGGHRGDGEVPRSGAHGHPNDGSRLVMHGEPQLGGVGPAVDDAGGDRSHDVRQERIRAAERLGGRQELTGSRVLRDRHDVLRVAGSATHACRSSRYTQQRSSPNVRGPTPTKPSRS